MKRLLIINILLIVVMIKIPLKAEVIETAKEDIKQSTEIVKQEVTSRSKEEPRKAEIKKNLYIDANSDLRVLSNLTSNDYNKMLKGTRLYGLGLALEQAEKESGINGLYLMGLACLESSYGNSNFARNRNNLVGWNAVDSNPNKATYFNSKEECIKFVANKLKRNYLTKGGRYHEGYTAKAIDIHYCTDKNHCYKIINIINKLEKKL